MEDNRLIELRNSLVNYDKIESNEMNHIFCHDCESKGLLSQNEKLERISHGADSNDFRHYVSKIYGNDIPVMFLMLDPSPTTQPFYRLLKDTAGTC